MAVYRSAPPQLDGDLFLTDGGLETTLIFHDGVELPDFAAFDLLRRPGGEEILRSYYRPYVETARRFGAGLVLESATWRASEDWGARLGYSLHELAEANRRAVRVLEEMRAEEMESGIPIVVSGCVGPRGDGYRPAASMTEREAREYHAEQVETLARTGADLVTAMTMTNVEEALGISRAAQRAGIPAVVSFTVETNGRLPTGQSLKSAVELVDAATSGYPLYYMINCAHPSHFDHVLDERAPWVERIRGLRANASCMSHAELDDSPVLDEGDPVELGMLYSMLRRRLPRIGVMGGCCGTDARHVEQIAEACAPLFAVAR